MSNNKTNVVNTLVDEEICTHEEDCPPEEKGRRNQYLGMKGEEAAARYLERRGYEILERNWMCPAGEADIIAFDGETLTFVEVKTRGCLICGVPEEAVTPAKRKRYENIAAHYIRDFPYTDIPVRFDVIGLQVNGNNALLRHHINAFGGE